MAQDPIQAKNQKIDVIANQSEFIYIENAFVKIGTLLALGYGEAGTSIIASNMSDTTMKNLGTGKKRIAIFGFCDIRNFTDATEVHTFRECFRDLFCLFIVFKINMDIILFLLNRNLSNKHIQ